MTQITDMQQRLIRNLSKGYRQRVDWRRQSSVLLGGGLSGRGGGAPSVEQQADLIVNETIMGQNITQCEFFS